MEGQSRCSARPEELWRRRPLDSGLSVAIYQLEESSELNLFFKWIYLHSGFSTFLQQRAAV